MELLALLSNRDDTIIAEVKKSLNRYTVYPLRTVEELEDLNTNIPLNLILIDSVSHNLSKIENLLNKLDTDMVILIGPEKLNRLALDDLPKSIYDSVDEQSLDSELPVMVERVIEKQKLKNELNLLRKARKDFKSVQMPDSKAELKELLAYRDSMLQFVPESMDGKYLQEKVLINFAKMLNVSFDMRKLFNHFMDSVMEIGRVSKMSILLRDKKGFYVKTHYGLDPYIADNLNLKKDSTLASWLSRTGRIMQKPVNPTDTASVKIKSEMDFLQCTYSFPMMYKGKLIGIFNIGNRITEEPFYREELEIIYMLCNYLAAAVKDIDLYNQIYYQKEFIKNILSSMNSGMIAIDSGEKITVFNQQASEILDLDSSDMVGKDLRNLPSPLGDILYETMKFDTAYKRHEVEIQPEGMPVGISSFKLVDEDQETAGAGLVFTDLSFSKKLAEKKSRAEKLEAVNDLMSKIAHEVRTPLTSIQTYTQILGERHSEDKELRDFFSTTVIQSIRSLDSLIDKLIIFSSKPEYNFEKENVNTILTEARDYISKNVKKVYKFSTELMKEPFFVNADKKLLIKALYYIVMNIIDRVPEGTPIMMSANTTMWGLPSMEISIKYEGDEITEEEKQNLLKPLLDIDNLGTELNVPISHKIIERHKGSLDIKSENGNNIFIIRLPGIERRGNVESIEHKHA